MALASVRVRPATTGEWIGRLCLKYVNRIHARNRQNLLCDMSISLSAVSLPEARVAGISIRCLSDESQVWDFVELCNRAYIGASDYQHAGWIHGTALRASGCFDPALTWFAYRDGEPIGFCLARYRRGRALIAGLGVLPAFRRKGIGRALLVHALKELAARGADVVSLSVAYPDQVPQRLYRDIGFRHVHTPSAWGTVGGDLPKSRGSWIGRWLGRFCLAYVSRSERQRGSMWLKMRRGLEPDYPYPDMGDIVLRPLGDARKLRDLTRIHNRTYVGAGDYERVGWIHANALRNSTSFDPRLIWIAYDGRKAIGYCMARAHGEKGHITGIAVDPRYRRRGIGTGLMCHALAALSGRGCRFVVLEVPRQDTGSQELYRKLGFAFCEEEEAPTR